MGTTTTVLIIYGLCFAIAITIVALGVVHALKPQPAKGPRKKKRKVNRREKPARKVKTARQPVLKTAPVRAAQRRPSPPRKRRVKPEPVEYEIPPEVDETWKASHSQGAGPWSGRKRMDGIAFSANTSEEQKIKPIKPIMPIEPESVAPSGSSEPEVDSADHTAPATAPPGQSDPSGAMGSESSDSMATERAGGASMGDQPGVEGDSESSEPTAADTASEEEEEEEEESQKSSLGDLADLFAKSADDFVEQNKLADEVDDFNVDDVLQEGLGLLDRFKRPGE